MKKYICTVCEYIYDPEQGAPESGMNCVLIAAGIVLFAVYDSVPALRSEEHTS